MPVCLHNMFGPGSARLLRRLVTKAAWLRTLSCFKSRLDAKAVWLLKMFGPRPGWPHKCQRKPGKKKHEEAIWLQQLSGREALLVTKARLLVAKPCLVTRRPVCTRIRHESHLGIKAVWLGKTIGCTGSLVTNVVWLQRPPGYNGRPEYTTEVQKQKEVQGLYCEQRLLTAMEFWPRHCQAT